MSKKDKNKKKSWIKRVLLILGILLVLLIGALVAIPFFYKNELKDLAIKEANKHLKADIALGDFDLTILTTFPKFKLRFNDVSVTGRNQFEGVKLVDLKAFEGKMNFWDILDFENLSIRSIRLVEPKIHVKVLQNGEANYDIVKTTEEMAAEGIDTTESTFTFSLQKIEIKNGRIIYDDRASNQYADIQKLNLEGKGDLTSEKINLGTKLSADALTFKMDGLTYLSKAKTDLKADLLIENRPNNFKVTLKKNKLKLNALSVSFDGYYASKGDVGEVDLKLNTDKISFKELLSLIPAFYKTGYEKMVAQGDVKVDGFVKGKLADGVYPAWNVDAKVENASISYPNMPKNIDKIYLVANSQFSGGKDMDQMTVNVDEFKAEFVGNKIDANFYLKTPMSDPQIKSKIFADVDLSTIDQVFPLEKGTKSNGKLDADIVLEGRMSSIEQKKYQEFTAKGILNLSDFYYTSPDLPSKVEVERMEFEFSPQQLKLANLNAKMGNSDYQMEGDLTNYMAYLFKDEPLKGYLNFHSNYLDLDELLPATEDSGEGAVADGQEETPVLVPKNIDFQLNTTINKLKYSDIDAQNVKGNVKIENEELILKGLSLNALEGGVTLNGKYNTQNKDKPKMQLDFGLKEVDIKSLADNFVTVDALAPIAKYISGKITTNLKMSSDLKGSFEPILNSLSGNASLFSSSLTISGFEPLTKLAETIQIPKLGQQIINNVNAYVEFKDGKVEVKPFDVKLGKITANVKGTNSFTQEIDYDIKLNIPKDQIPSQILKTAEDAIAQVKKLTGFKIKELPNEIPVTALVTNTISDPKVKTNFKEKLMEYGGNIKEEITEFVQDKVDEAKDSVKKIVNIKIQEVKENVEEQKQKILAEAQNQADKVVAEAQKLANRTRDEANKNAQKLIDEAGSNFLKKKAAELAADEARKAGEKSAKKIEDEAQKQADNIMTKARAEADKLK